MLFCSSRTDRLHPSFLVYNNEAVCRACHQYYSKNGVMRTTLREVISFHVAECRQANPPDSRCTSGCCSNCANPTCPFPRGVLRGRWNQVHFKRIQEQIVCDTCALCHSRHGIWRSETIVSKSRAAQLLKLSLYTPAQRHAGRLKNQMKELEDCAYGPTKTGGSGWCDLSCFLLLFDQKRSSTFDCVVFRKSSSLRSC